MSFKTPSSQQIIDLADPESSFPPAGLGHSGLAEIYLEWNDLEKAENHVIQGINLCEAGGIGYNLVSAYCVRALLR